VLIRIMKVMPWPKATKTLIQKRGRLTKPKRVMTRITFSNRNAQITPKVMLTQRVLYCKNLIFFSWLKV